MSGIPTGPFVRKLAEPVTAAVRVFAAWVGRGDDAPDVPAGWQHVGTSPDGQPMFAYIGPRRNPQRQDIEALSKAIERRFGG